MMPQHDWHGLPGPQALEWLLRTNVLGVRLRFMLCRLGLSKCPLCVNLDGGAK